MSIAARAVRERGARWGGGLPLGVAVAVAAVALGAIALFVLLPTYPTYDSYYHLVWGRQIAHGAAPSFGDYAAPTQHPLYLGICALVSLFGSDADRVLVGLSLLAFLAFAAGLVRLGRATVGGAAGALAVVFASTSFALLLYAARAYVDVWFLALVVWAAALAAEHPGRQARVVALLALAGLLRPEAWLLGLVYAAWHARGASTRTRLALAAGALTAPLAWCALDLLVTGDALFSLHATRTLGTQLEENVGVKAALVAVAGGATRAPVALLAVVGALLAVRRRGVRVLAVPGVLAAVGVAVVVALAVAGLAVLPRYLALTEVAVSLLAGYAVTGWLDLPASARARRPWALAALAGAVLVSGGLVAAGRSPAGRFLDELRIDRDAHVALVSLLRAPRVAGALRCGPLTFPAYRLVPDARWRLDLPARRVRPRSEAPTTGGAAVVVLGRGKLVRRFGLALGVPFSYNSPPPGFTRAARAGFLAAYVRCAY